MLAYVANLLALTPVVAVLTVGMVVLVIVVRAHPTDLPWILEILGKTCRQLLRRS